MRSIGQLSALIFISLFFSHSLFGQAPQHFHYQTLVKDALGNVVHDQEIGTKMTIYQDQVKVYEEVHESQLVQFGQLALQVGKGTPIIGMFNTIDWGKGIYTLQIDIDLDGGFDYTISQTRALNSMPYALHTNRTEGVNAKTEVERDAIQNPVAGQVVFCKNCGEFGQFQVFNGTSWTDALGQAAAGPILIDQLRIKLTDIFELNKPIPEGTLPLETEISPANASDKTATWSSSDETIATVDQNGLVTPISEGLVTISATANDNGGAASSIQFNFESERPSDDPPTDLHILGDSIFVLEDQRQFFALLHPFEEVDSMATWQSLNEQIASIDESGVVQALDTGRVSLVATASDFPALSDTLDIHIYAATRDIIFPVITVEGYDGFHPIELQRGINAILPTATAEDDVDGIVPVGMRLDESFNPAPFDSVNLTSYRLIFTTSDSSGNVVFDSVLVNVVDTLAPSIALSNDFNNGDTIYMDNTQTITIPPATAIDDNRDPVQVNIDSGSFDPTIAGLYKVFYRATDPNGNTRIDSLFILNEDKTAPQLTISDGLQDGDTIQVPQGLFYNLPTVTAIDEDGTVLPVLSDAGGFDALTMGMYELQYQAKDSSGNETNSRLIAYVKDNTAPVIENKIALSLVSASFQVGEEEVIAKVEASDNVGIASYEVFDLTTIGIYLAEDWGGTLSVNDNGEITAGNPDGGAFEADFYFRIIVTDSIGLKDSMDMRFVYSLGEIRDIRVKQYEEEDWAQLGQPYGPPNSYTYKLKEESNIGDTVLFVTAEGNAATTFEGVEFSQSSPGAGANDFELVNDGDTYYLRLVNTLDNEIQAAYDLNLEVVTRNVIDPSLVQRLPLPVHVDVASARELSPGLNDTYPISDYGVEISVDEILNPIGSGFTTNSTACPLQSASSILGDLADDLDQLITALPIIPEDTDLAKAKRLLQQLPAYFWLRKEGQNTRINMKIPVKGKTLRFEYVTDVERGGCYWGAMLDKLKPSNIHSRLSALDGNTVAGVVVNTLSITDKDFQCIQLPCLEVDPGAHVVATGKPTKEIGDNAAKAILSPTVFAVVTPLSAGFDDPELTVTLGLKADFKTEFNQEMVRRLDLASAATQTAIDLGRKGVAEAEKRLSDATRKLGFDLKELDKIDRQIARFTGPVSFLQSRLGSLGSSATQIAGDIASTLLANEICTPGICVVPCLTPGTCSRDCGFFTCHYPCLRSCGCEVRAPEICVPNPAAELLASVVIGRSLLNQVQTRIANATSALNRAQQRLAQASSPRAALEAVVASATDAVNQATNELNIANQSLSDVIANSGLLADVANYVLDNTVNKTVATSKAILVTTLASANNGTFSGELTVAMRILTAPELEVTFPQFSLNGNDIEQSLQSAVNIILDQID